MASLQAAVYLIECDGCRKAFGTPMGYPSVAESRAAAYVEGWRFPNHVTKTGNFGRTTSDVCPDCAPSWTPQRPQPRDRIISREELLSLVRAGGGGRG